MLDYRTCHTVRPRLGSEKPQGTPISEEELGRAMLALVQRERAGRAKPQKVATDDEKALTSEKARGRSNAYMKQAGERTEQRILAVLRRGPTRRIDIAREIGTAGSTVERAIARLREQGHVIHNRRDGNRFWIELDEAPNADPSDSSSTHRLIRQLRDGPVPTNDLTEVLGVSAKGVRAAVARARKLGHVIVSKRQGKRYWLHLEAGQ